MGRIQKIRRAVVNRSRLLCGYSTENVSGYAWTPFPGIALLGVGGGICPPLSIGQFSRAGFDFLHAPPFHVARARGGPRGWQRRSLPAQTAGSAERPPSPWPNPALTWGSPGI